jgi:hypothetical protein
MYDGCKSLSTVVFDRVSELSGIGESVFSGCSSLLPICLPSRLRELSDYALNQTNLVTISVSEGLHYFGISDDFLLVLDGLSIKHYFGRFEEVRAPDNIESLGSSCFAFCTMIRTVTFDSGSRLSHIEHDAFRECSSLSSICIPSSISQIFRDWFFTCYPFSAVTFEFDSKLSSIGDYGFADCSSLSSICISRLSPTLAITLLRMPFISSDVHIRIQVQTFVYWRV